MLSVANPKGAKNEGKIERAFPKNPGSVLLLFPKGAGSCRDFRASGELLYRNPRIGSPRGGAPARPPARCTVPTASRSRVRWCLTCCGAPPDPCGEAATAHPHSAPLGAQSFEKVALQPKTLRPKKSGSKFSRIFCPMAQSPGRFLALWRKRDLFRGNRKAQDTLSTPFNE